MEITEEQRKRSEANRIAALAKRKATEAIKGDAWKLFKCRKVSSEPDPLQKLAKPSNSLPERFRVRLEICSPDSFCVTPEPLPGLDSLYPGEKECLKKLSSWLSYVVPSHYTQNQGGGAACVYKLRDYDIVLKCLKKFKDIELQEIPWRTLTVIQKFSHSFCVERWIPCMPDHLSDENVDVLLKKLPHFLFDALLPFQHEGVRFGLRRGGSCLIADEMGLGKTIQAIAIACCFMNEGPILVVCPAILRFSWAEELERWLPLVSPLDIHLVFGHQDNPSHLTRWPRVVVISYTMLHRLRKSMLEQEWALLIVDESQHVRSTKKPSEPEEIQAVLDVAAKVKRRVLLSGTPSLSRLYTRPLEYCDRRPFDIFHQINILWSGLLGNSKYEFAKDYCAVKLNRGYQGKTFQHYGRKHGHKKLLISLAVWLFRSGLDFSKGVRLEELNVLLTQTVMVRRLKEHVMLQLPPKRRQVIRLVLKRSEIIVAVASAMAVTNKFTKSGQEIGPVMNDATCEIDANSGRLPVNFISGIAVSRFSLDNISS
ncbi:hypothetical protein GIB67_007249 [Kingdonia uniflora]|uniref:Helicase ATP-binding domain-containing protein n=1 Tax=Kingdonia uniflora TaxID=39325 RepID=A0A7J7NXT9_9MAGN|nr:hypothetical protein GIB67_007249 [Kingdonia uniflora]